MARASTATIRRRWSGTRTPPTAGEAMLALAMMTMAGRGTPKIARPRPNCWRSPPSSAIWLRRLQSRVAVHRGPGISAGSEARRRAAGQGRACPRPNTRWRRSTRKAALATRKSNRGGALAEGRHRKPTISTPKSNTQSRCSMAPAPTRTRPQRLQKAAGRAARWRRTVWRACLPPASAPRRTWSRRSKWHLISKQNGASDPELDAMFAPISAENGAKAKPRRSTGSPAND